MTERKPITEKDNIHQEWMKRAKTITLKDLPEFLRELTEDYEHDYGTICHAIAAAAIGAAWAVEKSPQGGITGFQAGAITWELLKGWGGIDLGKSGTRITNFDNLLYPQFDYHFNTINKSVWETVQSMAKEKLETENLEHVSKNVINHWKSIATGNVPFGLTIKD